MESSPEVPARYEGLAIKSRLIHKIREVKCASGYYEPEQHLKQSEERNEQLCQRRVEYLKIAYSPTPPDRERLPPAQVYVWGCSGDGRLGIPTSSERLDIPVPVDSLSKASLVQVSCGARHSLGLTSDGDVLAWGWNGCGQLGVGDIIDRAEPTTLKIFVIIRLLRHKKVVAISAGGHHSMALLDNGEVYSWGLNAEGQLGYDTDPSLSSSGDSEGKIEAPGRMCFSVHPKSITRLHGKGIVQLSCGGSHSMALSHKGKVYVWGSNRRGLLGLRMTVGYIGAPQRVRELDEECVSWISAGWSHNMVCTERGDVYAWGSGGDGRLGLGDCIDRPAPELVRALSEVFVVTVSCGYYHSAALTREKKLYTWGWGERGQLGNRSGASIDMPCRVLPLAHQNIVSVSCGGFHSMAIGEDGRLWAWGCNSKGQLGNPSASSIQRVPIVVSKTDPNYQVMTISCGWWHSLAITLAKDRREGEGPRNLLMDFNAIGSSREIPLVAKKGGRLQSGRTIPLVRVRASDVLVQVSAASNDGSEMKLAMSQSPISDAPFDSTVPLRRKSVSSVAWQGKLLRALDGVVPERVAQIIAPKEAEMRGNATSESTWEVILGSWHEYCGLPTTDNLILKGIPPSVRGRAWPLLIGNHLRISEEMYQQSLQVASEAKRSMSAEKGISMDEFALIDLDVPRTFSELGVFLTGGPLHQGLRDVLYVYAILQPQIAYVQGLSYPAGMLLLYMSDYQALVCLSNMLDSPMLRSFYLLSIDGMVRYLRLFDLILSYNLPKLAEHFNRIGLIPEQYLVDWFFTLFTKCFDIAVTGRVWDWMVVSDELFLFKLSVAMFLLAEDDLLELSFDGCMSIIRKYWLDIEADRLLTAITSITVPYHYRKELTCLMNSSV